MIVFIATLLVFLPALRGDFVEWDDPFTVRDNPHIRGLSADKLSWMFATTYWGHYQPLVWLSYATDHAWAAALLGDGLDPVAYHLTSVVLHAIAAALVALLALAVIGAVATPGIAAFAAAAAALFYGIHPLRVEAVAWVTGRGDVLVAVLLLLSTLAYVRSRRAALRRTRWFVASLAAYCLALLARGMAVTFPAVLVLLDIGPLRRLGGESGWVSPSARRVWLEKLPYAVLAVVFGIVAAGAKAEAGSLTPLASHGLLARAVQACYGVAFYLWKTVVPAKLSPIYELRLPLDLTEPRFLVGVGVTLALAVAAAICVRRRQGGVAALGAYALLLVPVLGFGQAGKQLAADRYATLAAIPLSLLAGAGLARLIHAGGARRGRLIRLGAVAILAALAAISVRQIGIWRETAALWTHAARVSPESSIAQNGYGWVLLQAKQHAEAERRLRQAIAIEPRNDKAWQNLWMTLQEQGREEELIEALRDAARTVPGFVDAHYRLGAALMRSGRLSEARQAFEAALGLRPDHVRARSNLGQVLIDQGDAAGAVEQLEQAVAVDPADAIARRRLAVALHLVGRRGEAIAQLERAVRLDPGDRAALELLRRYNAEAR